MKAISCITLETSPRKVIFITLASARPGNEWDSNTCHHFGEAGPYDGPHLTPWNREVNHGSQPLGRFGDLWCVDHLFGWDVNNSSSRL